MEQEAPKEHKKEQTHNAALLADALGYTVHEFNALVQLGEIKYDDDVTEKKLRKIYNKHYGGG